jgi:predicted MFS family arabinose efflux permease
MLGLVLVAVGVGMAYGSLVGTVLNQWLPVAGTVLGIVLLGAAASLVILIWLLSSILR